MIIELLVAGLVGKVIGDAINSCREDDEPEPKKKSSGEPMYPIALREPWTSGLPMRSFCDDFTYSPVTYDPLSIYIAVNRDKRFNLHSALEIGQSHVQLQLAERADRLGSDLVRLASYALSTDSNCSAVEVTDTIRTGVQRNGFFGSYWDEGAAITRTITVRKIR